MPLPTVSVCMVVRDDLPFLKLSFAAAKEYADQIVIVDNGSEDGTWEWLGEHANDGSGVIVMRTPKTIVPELGFSYLKNYAAQFATCDWVHSLDSDEILSAEQRPLFKHFLGRCKSPVVSIRTFTFTHELRSGEGQWAGSSTDWDTIANTCKWDDMIHRRIYRRDAGIQWKGYIHEELYQGELNAHAVCQGSDFKHLHFSNFRDWGDKDLKRARYAYMLMNAYRRPALQNYTNRWWYDSYVPQNKAEMEEWAERYSEMMKQGRC